MRDSRMTSSNLPGPVRLHGEVVHRRGRDTVHLTVDPAKFSSTREAAEAATQMYLKLTEN